MVDLTFLSGFFSDRVAKLVAAVSILLISILFARFFSKFIKKILKEVSLNKILEDEMGIKIPLEEFISSIISYVIYFIALIFALNQLGLTTTVLYIILLVTFLIIIALIVVAFKDLVPNLTAGFYINNKKNIKKGDFISVMNINGNVLDINLIETKIRTKEGDDVLIPNSLLLKSEVIIKK